VQTVDLHPHGFRGQEVAGNDPCLCSAQTPPNGGSAVLRRSFPATPLCVSRRQENKEAIAFQNQNKSNPSLSGILNQAERLFLQAETGITSSPKSPLSSSFSGLTAKPKKNPMWPSSVFRLASIRSGARLVKALRVRSARWRGTFVALTNRAPFRLASS